ncbi:MAG: hypothetical protein CSA64_02790 [Arachnia propionica]|nr:MAG: hypothetical protein CSA64_02790 [Arachnia propionica]
MVTVAEVAVDIGLAHLDHSFDYLVPERLLPQAQVGCRVKVPFSGRARDGWILACKSQDKAQGLAKLTSVVSAEPLLTPEVQALLRRVADHYGGNLTDVIRLAIPTRHASTEKAEQRQWPAPKLELQPQVMPLVPGGKRLLELLAAGEHPRVSWVAPPVFDTAGDITGGVIEAAASTLAAGRGVIIVVPTARALARVLPRCKATFGARSVATLSAELGPSARYRNYLAISRGQARIVVGTRSAVYAPVADLGLIAVIDEGSDALWEKRAPHPHAREVAALRSNLAKCALLLAGYSRSAEAAVYVQRNWLVDLHLPPREARRLAAPVRVVDDSLQQRDVAAARVRLPAAAFRLLRDHLPQGPVMPAVWRRADQVGVPVLPRHETSGAGSGGETDRRGVGPCLPRGACDQFLRGAAPG